MVLSTTKKDSFYCIETWFSCGVYIGFAHGYLHSIMLLVIDFMLFTSTLNKHTYVLDMIYVSGWVSYLRGQTQTGVPVPTWQGIQTRTYHYIFQFVCLLWCIGHCDNLHYKLHHSCSHGDVSPHANSGRIPIFVNVKPLAEVFNEEFTSIRDTNPVTMPFTRAVSIHINLDLYSAAWYNLHGVGC